MNQKLTYTKSKDEENPFLTRDRGEEPESELTITKAEPSEPKRPPIPIGPNGIVITDTDQATRFASVYFKSKLYPKSFTTAEQIVIAVLRASELGLPIFQGLEGMSVINNRCGLMGDLALALVEKSGLLEDIKDETAGEGDELTCTVTVKRLNRPSPKVRSFSVKQAKAAGIYARSTSWQGYPERMCYYRALGFALRDAFPDILKGMKTTEELMDYPTE